MLFLDNELMADGLGIGKRTSSGVPLISEVHLVKRSIFWPRRQESLGK
jgi:hypothetical protein